ncbi:MAG: hypothetical protein V3U15_01755 [Nitrospinota bacterium]
MRKPRYIKSIYDNEGKTIDRYAVFFKTEDIILGLSDDPDYPLGFAQCGEAIEGPHLGKKILWKDLPENVQKHIKRRMA